MHINCFVVGNLGTDLAHLKSVETIIEEAYRAHGWALRWWAGLSHEFVYRVTFAAQMFKAIRLKKGTREAIEKDWSVLLLPLLLLFFQELVQLGA